MPPPRLATQDATATSSTTTIEQSATTPITQTHGTLILRAEPAEQRRVQWAEDVVNNEGMDRKSSKVCCIYHRPHAVDESSGDESSSDSSDSDSESDGGDDGRARLVGGNRRGSGKKGNRHHGHDHDHDHGGVDKENGAGMGKGKARKRSPNAYEKQPHYVKKPSSGGNGGV